jgi:succinoglycan biosynthesis transport protein ExoP
MSRLIAAERPSQELASSEMHVRRLVRPFQRYGRMFIAVAALLAIVGALAILVLPRSYTAEVRLIAGNPNRDDTEFSDDGSGGPQQQTSLPVLNALTIATGLQTTQTYAELMQETPVAQRVVNDLHLPVTAEQLLSHIRVEPINDTPILSLKASWRDPNTAASIATDMASAFIDQERELVSDQATAGLGFIASQLPSAESEVRRWNQAVTRFMSAHHLTDATAQSTSAAAALDALDQKIAQTQVDEHQSQAQLSAIQSELGSTPSLIPGQIVSAPNPVVEQLRQQLSDAEVQLADNAQRFTDAAPVMIQLHRKISDLQERISALPATIQQSDMAQANTVAIQLRQQAALLSSQIQADSAAVRTMMGQRTTMLQQIRQLPGTSTTLAMLQRHAKLAQDAYYALLQKYEELTVAKSTALSALTVTQPASADTAVPSPSLKMGLIAVILLALAAAFIVVLALDMAEGSIGDERDVALLSDLPELGRIDDSSAPGAGDDAKRRLRIEAAYDEVLDAMRFSGAGASRTIAVLSPSQGDGRTTTAINLAIALAERGNRVLVVDADLRRPAVHKHLRVPEIPGLSDVLQGDATFDAAVKETAHAGIDVLTCGAPVRNAVETLHVAGLRALLDGLSGRYSTIILDTCALNPVHDALEVARSVDTSLLVVCAGRTRSAALARALDRISRAQIGSLAGYILNRARTTDERLAYYENRPSPVFAR